MSIICAEQHKQAGSKLFKDIEVLPRKLILHNKKSHHHHPEIINRGSPGSGSYIFYPEEMNNLHKFLPFNNTDAESDDPYESDHFRMYEFKIRRCTRSRSHDWTDCPFAHPGEKARRRDPRRNHYSGTVCSEYRRGGGCSRGDDCEFAHGVFECWLHPSRYRTEACKDGKNCQRKVCFFAHSPGQLRILPDIYSSAKHCCMYCHPHHSVNSSPTSTLLGNMSHLSRSPSLSPPLSPVKNGYNFSPVSRYNTRTDRMSIMIYKDATDDLISSLDAMSFNEVSSSSSPMSLQQPASPWIDVNLFNADQDQQQQFVLSPATPSPNSGSMNPFGHTDQHFIPDQDQQQQFVLSPATPSPNSGSMNPFGHTDQHFIPNNFCVDEHNVEGLASSTPDPDLGWVNELLM